MTGIHRQVAFFAVAGAIGFVVDAGILYMMLQSGTGPYVGRVISFLCAAFTTWQFNRRVTFSRSHGRSAWREWCEYLLAMAVGGTCNYAVYVLIIQFLHAGTFVPLIAVAGGSLAGMVINFASAKLWVFRHATTKRPD
ncbi:GtrA family protein [Burkholderia metallica]|uniref:GtrA family protein n=1 Tax=Burkholderia metallica TaxID=488729 RepID=UPI001CF3C446|nr:GtrA family protein [Burkholderia metallica]MCA8020417.1 GtrA family protein [Burkholderia metallica]